MKRLFVASILAACLYVGRAAAQTVTARVGGELTGFAGGRLLVPVVVDMSAAGGAKLGSYTARLSWNPSVLSLECSFGYCPGLLRGNFPEPLVNADSASRGVLRVAGISPAGEGGVVTLFRLDFSILVDTLSTPVDLQVSEMSAAGTFQNLVDSLQVISGTFCPARGRWGDLDRDGRSNSRDALAILTQIVGLAVDPQVFDLSVADVDGDDRSDSRDALIILSYAVGIDIPGQRVLLPVPSSCATGSARRLSILPAAVRLTTKQPFKLMAQGVDSLGRAVALEKISWRSTNPLVVGVDASGLVLPRSVGTASIVAEAGPGLRASATVEVIAQRWNWYVDARATGASIQLGTADQPFEHPQQAFAVAAEGDTVRVAPGTYFFLNGGGGGEYASSSSYDTSGMTAALDVGIVLIGGTPGDSSTRPVFRDLTNDATALWLGGGSKTVVRNLSFENFYTAIHLAGVSNFVLEDSRIVLQNPTGQYYVFGYGVYHCGGAMDTVRIERSTFLGDSLQRAGTAIYYSGCAPIRLTVVRNTKIRFFGDGLSLYEADSIAVMDSELSDNDGQGIYAGFELRTRPALYVSRSRIERNYFEAIYLVDARRLVVDNSVIRATQDDAIVVYGACCGPVAQVYLRGDSVYQEGDAEDYEWLDTDNVDSLVIDNTVVRFPADTNFYAYTYLYADKALVTNTKILNVGAYSTPFDFWGSWARFDNVEVSGCNVAGCDQGYGLYLSGYPRTVDAEVRNSRFTRLGYAVFVVEGRVQVLTANAVDSARVGFYLETDSAVVADNRLVRIVEDGVHVVPQVVVARGLSSLVRNVVACSPGPSAQRGFSIEGRAVLVEADTVTGCGTGLFAFSLGAGSAIRGTIIRNPVYGVWVAQPDSTLLQLVGNAISGADTAAVYVQSGRVLLRRNNIRNNDRDGLALPSATGYVTSADSNAFVGNVRYAIYAPSDSVDARYNWWGLPTGPKSGPGSDSVLGARVVTSPYLTQEPAGLPQLGPAIVAFPSAVSSPAAKAAVQWQAREPKRKVQRTVDQGLLARLPPRLAARLVEQFSREAEIRAQREARRAELRRAWMARNRELLAR